MANRIVKIIAIIMLGIINVFGSIISIIKNKDQIRTSIEKNKYIFSNQSLVNTIKTIALVGIATKKHK